MKMMNKIECDIDGVIERILIQNGDPVEYDEVLFLIS
jgi:acetyl-CoA carboxylase biotin carboxyl carrier protein